MSFPPGAAPPRRRLLLAGALPALLAFAAAFYLVDDRVSRHASRARERQLSAAANLVDQRRASRTRALAAMAHLVAEAADVRAAVARADPAARGNAGPLQQLAAGYQREIGAPFLLVAGPSGAVLASVGAAPRTALVVASQPAVREALDGRDAAALLPHRDGLLQLVTTPIAGRTPGSRPIGAVAAGFLLDVAFAQSVKTIADCEIAFGFDGQVLAATRPSGETAGLASRMRASGVTALRLGGEDYAVLTQPLAAAEGTPAGAGPVALVLRSSRDTAALLAAIHRALALTAAAAVLAALVLAWIVEGVGVGSASGAGRRTTDGSGSDRSDPEP